MIFEKAKSRCAIKAPIIVSSENKSTHRANNINGNTVFQFKIDGDIMSVSDSSLRCDYLVENEDQHTAYLIELKGTDLTHAFKQIEATITRFSSDLIGYTILPRIVYRSNTHSIHSSKFRDFIRKHPKAKVRTTVIEENI